MATSTIPPEILTPLTEEASKRGMSPEALALETLRKQFWAPVAASNGGSLLDFLAGHIGTIHSTGNASSNDCGSQFTEILIDKQQRGRL